MSGQEEFDFEAKQAPPRNEATAAIIERIKKLLRLGADKRGNPHEAERALQLAYELAEKYRVDVDGLDLDEATERVIHEAWETGMRYDRLRRGIVGVLISHFHVNVVLSQPEMLVVGKPTDVLIAHYVHDFLLRAGRNCLRAFEQVEKRARRRGTSSKRANYLKGFIWGLHAAIRAGKEEIHLNDAQNALVLAEEREREQYVEANWKTHSMPALKDCRDNPTVQMAGFNDGKNTTIQKPLNGGRGATLLLTTRGSADEMGH